MYRIRRIYKQWQPGRKGLIPFIALCLVLFLFIEGFVLLESRLRPAIISVAELRADIIATDAVNRAILENISSGIFYKDLVQIEQDENGRIVMAQLNSMEINAIMAKTTVATQNALLEISNRPFHVPLGEIFDNYLIATYGPKIPVRFVPAGRVNTVLVDSFESAGINQVRHKLYLDVVTEVRIIIPFFRQEVEVHTTVPLADTIYPGDVPDTVINLDTGGISLERVFP